MRLFLRSRHGSSPDSESLGPRLWAWCHQLELDRQLAAGADPAGSPELQARAHQLGTPHFRRGLLAQVDSALAKADHPPHWHSVSLAVQAQEVRIARESRRALRQVLAYPIVPHVRGLALAACLLNDPDGPLHRRQSAATIVAQADAATAALAPQPGPPARR